LAPLSTQKDKDAEECEVIREAVEDKRIQSSTRQLFLPYGGKTPIGTLILSSTIHPKYFSFYEVMQHILEAGSMLLLAGVCHFDLHPNNFLKDNYGVVRILDFGQSFNARKITEDVVDRRWKVLYFGSEKDAPNPLVTNSEAPELTTINAMRNEFSMEEAIKKVVYGKAIFREMERTLGISMNTSIQELNQFFTKSISVQNKNWEEFFKLYWTGFDAWAIGCLLLTILKYQISWAEFVQGEWQNRQAMTKMAIKGLLHPNPHKRLDCVEALFLFDPNNAWIRQFGKPWLEKRSALRAKLKN
jgi:serine/threonine protein kinase